MERKKINRVLVLLSVVYGIVVGVLGALESSALTVVAIVGGALLGVSWAAAGFLATQKRDRTSG
ncbi:hypothetical protein Lesp02_39150 [Lentzea sp. NBRC 105346]|uniref:hypothetical protein n=1 Tax=Lentzea sp. NBRC 105346 TaxID=3032205 RepID=UPI0024A037EE|nr:hypothetical protein [Lentzea sp. NBRC 105346]GLZ31727.1 hypothetical protein Lesp02_39150 [Lentzea sp. NBRC 105346]